MKPTAQEQKILDALAAVWNDLIALPEMNPHDNEENMRDIHNIQNRVVSRAAWRAMENKE